MNDFELFLIFLKAASLSSGGLQALPLLQEDLITQRQLLTYADFATAVAIGRISPGANGLFVLPIGYYISGLSGALVAALGIMLPPMLAIALVRAQQRLADRPWVAGMVRGLGASSVSLLSALGYSFSVPLTAEVASIGILLAALVILVATKADPLPVLGLGAAVAVGLSFFGVPLA